MRQAARRQPSTWVGTETQVVRRPSAALSLPDIVTVAERAIPRATRGSPGLRDSWSGWRSREAAAVLLGWALGESLEFGRARLDTLLVGDPVPASGAAAAAAADLAIVLEFLEQGEGLRGLATRVFGQRGG